MKHSRRYFSNRELIDRTREYSLDDGIGLLKKAVNAKFDESVELSINLGVDPRHADQMVRGTVVLPYGLGKTVRVLVLTRGNKVAEAQEAGADYVGLDEYIEKIKNGWLDFDVTIATPDVMREVGKLGRILGTRGLMPNPKSGTVTNDIAAAVRESKAGKIEFRVDKNGIVHTAVGKISFDNEKLVGNIKALIKTILKLRPAAAKGSYLEKITLSSTMGPGIRIDKQSTTA
ncbi:MAG TPA: 50S ribosomal protein L1 [Candidatus Marinimicrobia bacterium]|nr:50S ribosomal protein L1 [Candidatus Neomarinimicrobiota bacterium]